MKTDRDFSQVITDNTPRTRTDHPVIDDDCNQLTQL